MSRGNGTGVGKIKETTSMGGVRLVNCCFCPFGFLIRLQETRKGFELILVGFFDDFTDAYFFFPRTRYSEGSPSSEDETEG